MRLKLASPILKDRARTLRRTQTSAETLLWSLLRNRQLGGVRFRRQRPIGPYILDFYCPDAGLVVELDGAHHSQPEEAAKDKERTAFLEAHGLRVLRFANAEVLDETERVLGEIERAVAPSPRPSP